MKVIIKNSLYELGETGAFGREGNIYFLAGTDNSKLAKVYHEEKRTAYRQRKTTAIINRFRKLDLGGVENFIAFPELPIYDEERGFCGFVMKNFSNHSELFQSKYDLKLGSYRNEEIDDDKAMAIVGSLFAYLEVLHKAGFILGDVGPDNVLLDNVAFMPVVVDFDSAQVGTYYSSTHREEYIDPTVRIEGYGQKKHFIYTTDSDVFAMAIVCYEFVVGTLPYFFQTTIPTDTNYKKWKDLSFLDYFEGNTGKTQHHKFSLFENDLVKAVSARLGQIRATSPALYDFLRSVFSDGERKYFRRSSSPKYKITSKGLADDSEVDIFDLIPQPKEDPEELDLFRKQFEVELF